VPQVMCSDFDHNFTCLPFTSASGEAVCCVIIFQSKTGEVPLDWRMGIDASVNPIRNGKGEITVSHNVGTGKFHPGGPKCNYKGKEVDCFAFATESGIASWQKEHDLMEQKGHTRREKKRDVILQQTSEMQNNLPQAS